MWRFNLGYDENIGVGLLSRTPTFNHEVIIAMDIKWDTSCVIFVMCQTFRTVYYIRKYFYQPLRG